MKTCDGVDVKRPVVFLDMCGVLGDTWLNQEEWAWSRQKRFNRRVGHLKSDVTVRAPHELLIDIFRRYSVQVIVVSSWLSSYLDRDHPDVVSFTEFLGYPDVLGSLYTSGGYLRGEKVKEFVLKHNLKKWVVIDDSREQMYLDTEFFNNDHFVHPCGRFGFWQKEAEHLSLILGSSGSNWERGFHGLSLN